MSAAGWGLWLVAALFTGIWSLALLWYWALVGMADEVAFAWMVTMAASASAVLLVGWKGLK